MEIFKAVTACGRLEEVRGPWAQARDRLVWLAGWPGVAPQFSNLTEPATCTRCRAYGPKV